MKATIVLNEQNGCTSLLLDGVEVPNIALSSLEVSTESDSILSESLGEGPTRTTVRQRHRITLELFADELEYIRGDGMLDSGDSSDHYENASDSVAPRRVVLRRARHEPDV